MKLHRRRFLSKSGGFLALASLTTDFATDCTAADAPSAKAPKFDFYVMDTGLRGTDVPTLESKVQLAKKLGFVGIGYTLNHRELPRLLELLDKEGLELSAVYTTPQVEGEIDPGLADSVKRMKGRKTRIELAIGSKRFKPSDPEGDKLGVALLKAVSDLATDSGPVVSVYPHIGSWTERVEDGVRLAKQAARKNVGTHFNLVHWSWVAQKRTLPELLTEALPYMFAVTINGLDGKKIVSLDQGNYDIDAFLALLKKTGYQGLVGLQGYGVPGRSGEHLQRSIQKWRESIKKLQ